ncbi:MAG TPA: hypothetical protein VGD75_08530, partial [Bradyrhizobium sp.]
GEEGSMRLPVGLAFALLAAGPASAKDLQFWNQTSKEFQGVYLAPAGSKEFGPNQADNDADASVSADERLKITGVTAGRYDVKLVDKAGHICIIRDVQVTTTGKIAFAISEKQLSTCPR